MPDFVIDDEYRERVDSQFEKWSTFLNTSIGFLSFTLALASMGTPAPVINSWLSLIVVILIRISGAQFFPQEIKDLRKKAKTNPNAKIVLDGLEARHFSAKATFKKYHLFVFGIVFLFCIAFSHIIVKIFPAWAGYVGI